MRRECNRSREWLRGQSGKYEGLLKLPFLLSPLSELILDPEANPVGPTKGQGPAVRNCSFLPSPPLFSLLPLQVTGTFLLLLRFSLPIPMTSVNLLCPLLFSILFFFIPGREKEGALAPQLFICKYFLYFCPDLAKFGVLQEQATKSLLFPSGILSASFLASKAVYKTNRKLTFFYPCCKTCFIIMCPILKCICGLNPPNM